MPNAHPSPEPGDSDDLSFGSEQAFEKSIADWAYHQFFELGRRIHTLDYLADGMEFLLKIQQLEPYGDYLTERERNDLEVWKFLILSKMEQDRQP